MTTIPNIATVAVGKKYESKFGDGSDTPWLDNNPVLQKQIAENKWKRWDGVEGSAQTHLTWMYNEAKSLMSKERSNEFRHYGEKNNCTYYIHDELTASGDGYGLFKVEGVLKLEPKDMVAACFDFKTIAKADKTVVFMKFLKFYEKKEEDEPSSAAAYWCNAPGFPFYYRDGVDLTGYKKDDDGILWQFSVSAKGENFISMPGALDATDRYWAYRLEPNGDGTTNVTLICQTLLNGYMPKFLTNYLVCSVLIDYMQTITEVVEERKKSGKHQAFLKQMKLDKW